MKQRWAGLGGGGLKVSYELIRHFFNENVIVVKKGGRNQSNEPATPEEQMNRRDEGENNTYNTYLESSGSDAEISYYGLDTDSSILSTIAEIDTNAWNKFGSDHKDYFVLLKDFGGSGTGAIPERIDDLTENTPAVPKFIDDVHGNLTDLFVPVFSLDGGSGFGFFKQHMELIDKNNQYSIFREDNDNGRTVPFALFPHWSDRNRRCVWAEEGIERTASDNAKEGIKYIENRLEKPSESGLIDFCVVLDNDFAAYNAICNTSGPFPYKSVTEGSRLDIMDDSDFTGFYKDIPELNYELANTGIKKATLPITSMFFRSGTKFGKTTMDGYDHTDLNGFFKGNFVVPAYLDLEYRQQADDIFTQFNIDSWSKKLGYLSYYTLCLSCAPFEANNINNIKVFVWEKDTDGITEDIRQKIEELVSGIGVDHVTVDPVVGIQDDSSAKIWTLTGVESIEESLTEKLNYER